MRPLDKQPSRLERYIARATPDDFDTDNRVRAQQLLYASVVLVPIILLFAVLDGLGYGSAAAAAGYATCGITIALGVPWSLRHLRSINVTTHIVLGAGAALLLYIGWLRGGFPWSNLVWLLIAPSLGSFMFSSRAHVVVWTIISGGALTGFFALHVTGAGPTPQMVLTPVQETTAGAVSLIGWLAFFIFVVGPVVESRKRLGAEGDLLRRRLQQAQRLESLGALASEIAHDFGNVLGAVMTTGSMLERRVAKDDPRRGDVELICDAADRGRDMIRQLMSFVRTGQTPSARVAVGGQIGSLQPLLSRLVGKRVTLSVELSPSLGDVSVDPNQFDRVLVNLATNARDAMPGGGRLVIRASSVELEPGDQPGMVELEPGVYALIEVVDTGSGMPPDVAERIFEPFFTTKGDGEGAGLGLSIVYGIVRAAEGDIAVDSAPGRGTSFRIFLPACEGEIERSRPGVRPA